MLILVIVVSVISLGMYKTALDKVNLQEKGPSIEFPQEDLNQIQGVASIEIRNPPGKK